MESVRGAVAVPPTGPEVAHRSALVLENDEAMLQLVPLST
jgi:hypothetical protein